jgi:chromatin modification-related protein EAF6
MGSKNTITYTWIASRFSVARVTSLLDTIIHHPLFASMPTIAPLDTPLPGSLEEAQQRYETAKKALKSGISKKRQIDRTLTDLESQIFLFEGSYLTNTAASGGNIVKGFDSYLKTNAITGGGSSNRYASINTSMLGNQDVPIEDRMFSLSSATYKRSLEMKANEGRSREESPVVSRKDKDKDRDSVQRDKERETAKQLKRKERESMGNSSSVGAGEGKSHKKKRKEED